jgi:hypothetical protein
LHWFWWWNMTYCIIQYLDFVHCVEFNLLNAELNPICHLLALLGAHPIFHIHRIRVKSTKFSTKCSEMVLSVPLVQGWLRYLSSVAPLLILMPEHCSVCCIFKHSVVDQIQHDRQCTYNVTLRRLLNHCRERKNKIYYLFSVCVSVAVVIQHAKLMGLHYIVICGLSWSAVIFSHYFISGIIFGKNVLNIKYMLWFSLQLCLKRFSFWEELSMIA